jgi:hypothetical protein
MENNVSSRTADIYSNDGIKVSIPLTGKSMPDAFKKYVLKFISKDIEHSVCDEILETGSAAVEFKRGDINLVMTINHDGTFAEYFILEYRRIPKRIDEPCVPAGVRIMRYDITIEEWETLKKKALRIIKRISSKGLEAMYKASIEQ